MVDGQGLAGRGARRVGGRAGEALPEDEAHAIPGNVQFVRFRGVAGGSEVAADPRSQSRARVRAHRELRVVQSAGHRVLPVQERPAVRAQEGVGNADLVHRKFGAGLNVHTLTDVEGEAAVRALRAEARVHVDTRHALFRTAPEKPGGAHRELAGVGAVGGLPGPLRRGPVAGVVDALRAGAAPYVAALTFANRASPQQLGRHLAQERPHLARTSGRSAPKTCLPWVRGGSRTRSCRALWWLPRAWRRGFLSREHGAQLLHQGVQLQLVSQPEDAVEHDVHAHGGAHEPKLLGGHPGVDAKMSAPDEQGVQNAISHLAMHRRIIGMVI